jgi:hypothetical protein
MHNDRINTRHRLIPIVVAVALAAWVFMVYHANRYPPGPKSADPPDHEVTGGIFEGEGRQLMPRRGAPPREASSVPEGGSRDENQSRR